MNESEKKDNSRSKSNNSNPFTLVHDESSLQQVVNAIQESYIQAGVYHRGVEK